MLGIAVLSGCASSNLYKGRRALRNGDSSQALQLLRTARAEDPTNPVLLRELGVASYKQAEYDSALSALLVATAKRQNDARAFFYLGAAHEAKKDYMSALDAYGRYAVVRGDAAERREMEKRLGALRLRQLQIDYRRAFNDETKIDCTIQPNTIAVVPFDATGFPAMYSKIGRGVAVLVMNDLAMVRSLRVVERLRLNVLLKELQLAGASRQAAAEFAPELQRRWDALDPEGAVRRAGAVDPTEMFILLAAAPARGAPGDATGGARDAAALGAMSPITTVVGIKQRLAMLARPASDVERAGQPYYVGPIDARVDSVYIDAITSFQADMGLDADGIVGTRTRGALQRASRGAPPLQPVPSPSEPQSGGEVEPPMPAVTSGGEAPPATAIPWTSRVDAATAPRLGRILCARTLVTGSVLPLAGDNLRIDALPTSSDGTLYEPGAAQGSGILTRLFEVEKQVVLDVVETKMRITLSEEERRAILGGKPPRNFDAFLAFCNGLDLEADGRYREAALEFRRAAAIDPGFQAAKDAAQMDEELFEADQLQDPEMLFDPPSDVEELGTRLETSLMQVNTSHAPAESEDTEVRGPTIGDPPNPPGGRP